MTWYDVLKEVRRISKRKPAEAITSSAAAKALGIHDNVASAWLGKFVRWGYLTRAGSLRGIGKPKTVYVITKWGTKFKPRAESP